MGMLSQRTPVSLCDNKKSGLSYQMFWNNLLFDEQVWIIDTEPTFVRRVRTHYRFMYPYPKFHPLTPNTNVSNSMKRIHGHTRMRAPEYELQQWSTFYFDVYAEKIAKKYSIPPPKIIAMLDGDSQFQTYPTLQSVFPESNYYSSSRLPRNVGGRDSELRLRAFGVGRGMFSEATRLFLNRSQVADFMVTFPVYVYTDTLSNLRQYVENLHNMSFDEAFEKSMIKSRTYYSQFAIILSYAYWFERDRYSFHIQPWPGNELNKYYSDLVPDSVPQPRVTIHMKSNPRQALMKGCCFSYQLNNSVAQVSQEIDEQDWVRVRELCNSFGDYENHYEATCEYLQYPSDPNMHLWRQNDTMTKHYKSVASDLQYLSTESKNKKIVACIHYLLDPTPDAWFPHSNSGCLFP